MKAPAMPPAAAPVRERSRTVRDLRRVLGLGLGFWVERVVEENGGGAVLIYLLFKH